MDFRPIAGVVWYAVGRFYEAADGLQQDLGYFALLRGITGPLFSGPVGEATAHFTFRAEPFRATAIQNGDLSVTLDATGSFSLFFNPEPCGDFTRPDTFSRGQRIATFRRLYSAVGTSVGPVATNLFSAELQSSADFTFRGRSWNLARDIPQGITQFGTASTAELPSVPGFPKVKAFVGSAMALGGNVNPGA